MSEIVTEVVNALEEITEANRVRMNTSIFDAEAFRAAKERVEQARERYIAAMKAYRPSWIIH